MGVVGYLLCLVGRVCKIMATSSWRLEDLQQLEELGLAGQLESTRLQEEDVGVDATPAAGAGHSLEQPEPDLYAMG